MPRYFFHTVDGAADRDTDGSELPDVATARIAAIRYAGAILSDQPDVLWDGRDFRVQVTDESGAMLFTIITLAVDSPEVSTRS